MTPHKEVAPLYTGPEGEQLVSSSINSLPVKREHDRDLRKRLDAFDRPGARARRNRDADIASSRRTLAHLRDQREAAMNKGDTVRALDIQSRITVIEARIRDWTA